MSLFVVIFAIILVSTCNCILWLPVHIKTCVPRFHAWQPIFGFIPENAFEAGIDKNGDKKYIARVISPDSRSWSTPTTLSGETLILHYNWGNRVQDINKFVEVLVVTHPHNGFGFRKTSKHDLEAISQECCLVEGGSGYRNGEKIVAWVGRTLEYGKYYIGGVREAEWNIFYVNHPMRYLDEVGTNHGKSTNFEVLAYDCCTKYHCRGPNKADCCFDMFD